MSARLKRCVIDLTDPTRPVHSSSFFDIFVLSLSKYEFLPAELLRELEQRVEQAPNDIQYPVAERVCVLLGSWVRCCLNRDFLATQEGTEKNLYSELMEMLGRLSEYSLEMKQLSNRVKLALLRAKPKFVESAATHKKKKKKRRRALSRTTHGHSLFDFSITDIASQINYEEARVFRRIHSREFMDLAWQKNKEQAPHIVSLVNRFNAFSFSISYMICICTDTKERVRIISNCIALAQALYESNNFNGLMEVLSGLNANSVTRLKRTISSLDDKAKEQWRALDEIMSVKPNYARYREALKAVKGIGIPFLGVHLRDLVFADEGNPDFVDDFVNIEKIEMTGNTLATIHQYQDAINSNYKTFILDKEIQQVIAKFTLDPPDEAADVLYGFSTAIEPVISQS